MLKKLFLLILLSLLSLNVFAHGNEWIGSAIIKDAKWSPVQISFWPLHLCGRETTIYGLNFSPDDKDYAKYWGQDIYLATPNDLFKQYVPPIGNKNEEEINRGKL